MIKLVGKHADLILQHLKSWSLEDGSGIESDSLTLTINSCDADGLPPRGERYSVSIGGVERDHFQISKRSFSLSPRDITLVLTVAPFSIKDSSGYRERKSMSWDDASLAQIVNDCVSQHGFKAVVHPDLQAIKVVHVDRTDESAQAFLRRLAKNYDAVAKAVNDCFVFAPKGKAKSATGKSIEKITLSLPPDNQVTASNFVNVTGELDGSKEYNGVKVHFMSTKDGKREEFCTGIAPFKKLGKDQNSKEEAEQTCLAELRKIKRTGKKITIQAPANPNAFAEGLIELDGSFPSVMQGVYSIDTVSISGQGLQTTAMNITATLTGD